jgi:hypothetical protein
MKLTKDYLKEVIKEELESALNEAYKVNPETMRAQALYNIVLSKMNYPLPELKIDGKFGPNTEKVADLIRSKLKKGETMSDGLTRLADLDKKEMMSMADNMIALAQGQALDKMQAAAKDLTEPAAIATPKGPESPVDTMLNKAAGDIEKAAKLSDEEKKRFQKLANVADQLAKAGK